MMKILSLDGGGIKGVFEAAFLAQLEETLSGGNIASYFDLIAGTSTGGILALGLGLGFSATEMLDFYETLGPQVFARRTKRGWVERVEFPAYDAETLRECLEEKFADMRLGDSKTRLIIPALNRETAEVYLFKTAHLERLEHDYKKSAVEVALATAAAPTWFPAHRLEGGLPLVDGGLFAGNPVGIAAVEAVGYLGWPMGSIRVLSVGATSAPPNVKPGWLERVLFGRSEGLAHWGPRLLHVFMNAQASAANGIAGVLSQHQLVRVSPNVAPGRFGMDSIDDIPSLVGLGKEEARKRLDGLQSKDFFGESAAPFVPLHEVKG